MLAKPGITGRAAEPKPLPSFGAPPRPFFNRTKVTHSASLIGIQLPIRDAPDWGLTFACILHCCRLLPKVVARLGNPSVLVTFTCCVVVVASLEKTGEPTCPTVVPARGVCLVRD